MTRASAASAVRRALVAADGRFSVRQRLLGIVVVAALVFAVVAAVSAAASSSVAGSADTEHRIVALQERYLVDDALLAKVRGQVYEVLATAVGTGDRQQALTEYADLRGRLHERSDQVLEGLTPGRVLDAAVVVAAGEQEVLTAADAAVAAAATDPLATPGLLERLDERTDALEEPFDTLLGLLAEHAERTVDATRSSREIATRAVVVTSAVGVGLLLVLALLTAASIVRGLRGVTEVAGRLARGDFDARFTQQRSDEIGVLGSAFNATADSLREMMQRLDDQRRQDTFGRQLNEALEMADTEEETYDAVRRSFAVVSPEHPMELLVADSSKAHLELRAAHPLAGGPGCPVESPFGCVAVRRGTTTTFPDSRDLNACPKLRERVEGPLSAVCVPVTFMGRALGVVHSTAPVGDPHSGPQVTRLTTVAAAAGARIGTVRSFELSQLQASTDGLTGLMNRRTFETTARQVVRQGGQLCIVMADLDHFKRVNDTHGHEAGDRALQMFAQQLGSHLRSDDLVARYGGEEFVALLRGVDTEEGVKVLDRFRARLAKATAGRPPPFTCSFGIVDGGRSTSLAGLVRRADVALYRAKAAGRDRVAIDDGGPEEERRPDRLSAVERSLLDQDPVDGLVPRA